MEELVYDFDEKSYRKCLKRCVDQHFLVHKHVNTYIYNTDSNNRSLNSNLVAYAG